MVSFGQSSGMVNDVNLHSTFNPKSLYYTRPTLMHYIRNSEELTDVVTNYFQKLKIKKLSLIYSKNLNYPKLVRLMS